MTDDASAPSHAGTDNSAWDPPSSGQPVGPAIVRAVLDALTRMARINRRHEADVTMCLHRAHVVLEPGQRDAALLQLLSAEWIERVIPLADGGTLVRVTEEGMRRSGCAA